MVHALRTHDHDGMAQGASAAAGDGAGFGLGQSVTIDQRTILAWLNRHPREWPMVHRDACSERAAIIEEGDQVSRGEAEQRAIAAARVDICRQYGIALDCITADA